MICSCSCNIIRQSMLAPKSKAWVLQAALIMKILRGQYRPITGFSADLTDVLKRCLTQSTARRPDTGEILFARQHRPGAASNCNASLLYFATQLMLPQTVSETHLGNLELKGFPDSISCFNVISGISCKAASPRQDVMQSGSLACRLSRTGLRHWASGSQRLFS